MAAEFRQKSGELISMVQHHASGIVIGDRGVLIEGASGSGKSSLAFACIDHARSSKRHAAFIGDDQILLRMCGGRIVAEAPRTIAGQAEWSGHGIVAIDTVSPAMVDIVVRLMAPELVARLPDSQTTELLGVMVPLHLLPERQAHRNALLIARLTQRP